MNLRRTTARLLLVAGVFLAGRAAMAGAFNQSLALPMTLEHDTNLALTTPGKGVTRSTFDPNYNLTATYGIDEYKLGLGLRVERSSDQQISANREDPNLSFGWQHQAETGEFGLVAKYDEASTRFTELEEAGLIQADGTRKTYSLGGNWRTALSERNSLAADAEYKDVAYDGGTLTDYINTTAGITYSHAWNEHIEPFVRATASHYEPSNTMRSSSSSNLSVLGGVKWKMSESLDWTAQAGPSRTTGDKTDTGWQGSFVLHYLGQRQEALFDAGRSVSASGEGGFIETDQIKGTWGYAFNEFTHVGLDASSNRNRGIIPNTMQQVGAWTSRELSPFWDARLSYQYRRRQQDGLEDATANVFGISLVYHPLNF